MDFTIRELNPQACVEDTALLVPAYLSIWNHPDNLPFLSFTGLAFTEPQVREWFSTHQAAGVRFFAAAHQADVPVAVAITRENPVEGFELWGLGIAPAHKRLGLGRRLVRKALEVAKSAGYLAVDTQVFASNAPMLCLLLTDGFLPVRMDHHRGPAGEDIVHLKFVYPI